MTTWEPGDQEITVILRGGPSDGQRITADALATEVRVSGVRYVRTDETGSGGLPVYRLA